MALVVQLLGTVQVSWDEAPLKFATEHTRALLAYLVVEANVVHQRTRLATLLWPEESETTARHNLRQVLFSLKQTLAVVPERDALLQITATTLQWNRKGVTVDLYTFHQGWEFSQTHSHANQQQCAACIEQFCQAVALYQGEFLQGLLIKNNYPFEEWTMLRREQIHRQVMVMLSTLTAHYASIGDYAQAQHYAIRQVAFEPWQEEGHRQLMRALVAQGQQSAALRQYESCRRILEQELGAPPSGETTRLYEQIRTGNFNKMEPKGAPWQGDKASEHAVTPSLLRPVVSSRLHNLPTNLAPLVGRNEQLTQLRSLLDGRTQRLLTIVGMGGMGKSRLALALLEQLAAETPAPFPHGVWFVSLSGVTAHADRLSDALAGATLKALDVITFSPDALQRALFHYLTARRLLLVLDNFEQFLVEEHVAAAATAFLHALLHAAPGVTLVVTSRLPLQLLAETVIRLVGLPVPGGAAATADKRDVANYESVRLFVYHAQRALPSFALCDHTLTAVIDLCRTLSGMPLAIELAAALTPHFTPSELVIAIRQNLALLASSRRDLDARHRQFSAVLQSSWQLLSDREQQVLTQSAIFVGRFSRAAAQAVTGATVSELAGLVDKALIQQPGVGVYQLHELLRQFANDKLQQNHQEALAVANRHSDYYLSFVAQREQMLARQAPRQAVEGIQGEVDNVRQAWAWAADHTTMAHVATTICARLAKSAYSLWQFYLITGLYTEGVAAFRQAVEGAQAACAALDAPTALQGSTDESMPGQASDAAALRGWQSVLSSLLAFEAYLLGTQGKYNVTQPVAEQAIALGVVYGNHEAELLGLAAMVQAHYYQGKWGAAQSYTEQLLERVQQLQGVTTPSESYYDAGMIAYLYLGVIAKNADDYAQAQRYITQVLELCQPLGKLRGVMHARLNLANLARYKQDYTAARQDYERVLQIAAELGYRRGEAITRYELADVMRGQGEYTRALAELEHALAILREIGEPFHENYALIDIGRIYAYLGDYAQAQALVQQALTRCANFTIPDAKLETWLAAALLHQLTGEATEALAYATHAQEVASASGNRRYEGCAWLYLGNALAILERWGEAATAYTNALQHYQELDIQPVVAEAQAGLARAALAHSDQAAALAWVEKSLSILAEYPTFGLDEPFQIYLTCYHVLTANADPRAVPILQRGITELLHYADQITDRDLRRSFLENVPTHQALYQAYQIGASLLRDSTWDTSKVSSV